MTLTAMMPSMRRTLPDPLNIDVWPEHSCATTTDVVVAGVSLVRLVEICQTPCVHSGDAVIPGTRGKRFPNHEASVVIARVTAVLKNCDATRVVLIDARLDHTNARWHETRLIGRASTARSTSAVV
ncbi:MAG TPA: hypothetical protein VGP24_13385, partial [Glaciihabitans sp.]|nr:hypothetical protein [Glaciihabitans sp.]